MRINRDQGFRGWKGWRDGQTTACCPMWHREQTRNRRSKGLVLGAPTKAEPPPGGATRGRRRGIRRPTIAQDDGAPITRSGTGPGAPATQPSEFCIKIRIDTTIPVTSPKNQAAITGRSSPKKTVVQIAMMIGATAPASKTSLQFTRFILCRLQSIPSTAKSQKPAAARKVPRNISPTRSGKILKVQICKGPTRFLRAPGT